MPMKEALRERIELFESRIRGQAVKVVNLRMRVHDAVADLIIGDARIVNLCYVYNQFFLGSKLRSFKD